MDEGSGTNIHSLDCVQVPIHLPFEELHLAVINPAGVCVCIQYITFILDAQVQASL